MEQQPQDQIQFLLADFNTRLRDLEERNKLVKNRTLLLGKNLITTREQITSEIDQLRNQSNKIQKDLEKLTSLVKSILSETRNFVRKDEVIVLERMLKDFQPLDFARIQDVKDMISEKLKQKQIKTIKTKK